MHLHFALRGVGNHCVIWRLPVLMPTLGADFPTKTVAELSMLMTDVFTHCAPAFQSGSVAHFSKRPK